MTLASLTAALMLSAAPAIAQMQQEKMQKGSEGGGPPQAQGSSSAPSQSQEAEPGPKAGKSTAKGRDSGDKGAARSEGKSGKASASQRTESKGKSDKQRAEKSAEPKEKSTKGSAQKSAEPQDRKGTAEKSGDRKGTAEKSGDRKSTGQKADDADRKGTAQKSPEPKDKAAKSAGDKRSGDRVRVSEREQTNVRQAIKKHRDINRVNVNFSVSIGTRVPRSVHLVALPPAVIAIVPAYRSYRYFVVNDQLCIVDPATYEIVEIIVISDQTAGRSDGGASAALVLSDAERALIIEHIDVRGGSTLGLGALSVGADVPRDVELRVFPNLVVEKVPKLKEYKFFTAESRIAIVDPRGSRVELVLENRR